MKILAIRGRNLASLAEDFEVDFGRDPLAQAGLFAISGPTGSGKSTLLDALCLALYGGTPRLLAATSAQIPDVHDEQVTAADPRNLLRRGKGEGYAEVDFVGVDGVAYRARWSVKRARGRSDGRLQQADYLLARVADGQPVVGTRKSDVHPEIERLVGLSFSQFTRAVLLAQNDFAAFLKAGDDERAALLQTLTGTERFEQLSRRVYARHAAEKARLDDLERQRTETPPLDDAARTELDRALAAARQAVADLEQQKARLDAALGWHQADVQLARSVQTARAALDQALQRQAAAGERRAQLRRADAVAPARPLQADCARLEADALRAGQELETRQDARQAALTAHQSAESARAQAQGQLETAQAARKSAQPDLDAARTLDTQIHTLTPQWEAARKHHEDAQVQATRQQAELGRLTGQRTQALEARSQAASWLAEHGALAALAEHWSHWAYLLEQAQTQHAEVRSAEAALAQGRRDEALARRAATEAETALAGQDALRRQAEARFGEAQARYGAFDPDALARARAEAETLRTRLAEAQAAWSGWRDQDAALAEVHQARTELARQQQDSTAERAALAVQRPVLEGRLRQAEQSLGRAMAACNQDVDSLRAGLEADAPCPVCGSLAHPYHAPGENHRLKVLLDAEQAECSRMRRELDGLIQRMSALDVTLKLQSDNLAQLDARAQNLAPQRDQARRAWQILLDTTDLGAGVPLGQALADTDAADLSGWFQARRTDQETVVQSLVRQDEQLREAQKLRDAAQGDLNQAEKATQAAAAKRQQALDSLNPCRQAVSQAEAGLAQASQALETNLSALEEPLTLRADQGRAGEQRTDWRSGWRQDPAAFRAGLAEGIAAFQQQREAQSRLERQLDSLQHQIEAAETVLAKARERARQTQAELTRQDAEREAKLAARAALLAGRAAAEAEAALDAVVAKAQAQATGLEQALGRTKDQATQATTFLELARATLAKVRQALADAVQAREAWLARFNAGPDSPLDLEGLRQLLELDPDRLAGERRALDALDQTVASARTVLDERQSRHAEHRSRPPAGTDPALPAEALGVRLKAVSDQLAADKAGVVEREILQRQDDGRRARLSEIAGRIQAQATLTDVWAKLNDMVGSADGRKFRRIAQQHTLEVLLGYANRHLADLSRRYRLERLPESLTLLVVDQDMADERRSVHSLSGGESFLVSLALALGLASLSSHSVKVESLFIDEGFGSLDAETLAVAMNALDNLQAQGRKVGVISHVQEMTERIGVRIEVRTGAGGRSELAVSG